VGASRKGRHTGSHPTSLGGGRADARRRPGKRGSGAIGHKLGDIGTASKPLSGWIHDALANIEAASKANTGWINEAFAHMEATRRVNSGWIHDALANIEAASKVNTGWINEAFANMEATRKVNSGWIGDALANIEAASKVNTGWINEAFANMEATRKVNSGWIRDALANIEAASKVNTGWINGAFANIETARKGRRGWIEDMLAAWSTVATTSADGVMEHALQGTNSSEALAQPLDEADLVAPPLGEVIAAVVVVLAVGLMLRDPAEVVQGVRMLVGLAVLALHYSAEIEDHSDLVRGFFDLAGAISVGIAVVRGGRALLVSPPETRADADSDADGES
jgi:hypothetical protein